MANSLKIVKKSAGVFWHYHNNMELSKFAISDFAVSIDGDNFKIVEKDGAKRYNYLIQNITIVDETLASEIETFESAIVFYNRLISLNYTPFQGLLITLPAFLEMIDYPVLVTDGVQDFEIPSGKIAKNVFINKSQQLFLETANNAGDTDTFSQTGTTVTINQPTEIGNYIAIFYQ